MVSLNVAYVFQDVKIGSTDVFFLETVSETLGCAMAQQIALIILMRCSVKFQQYQASSLLQHQHLVLAHSTNILRFVDVVPWIGLVKGVVVVGGT